MPGQIFVESFVPTRRAFSHGSVDGRDHRTAKRRSVSNDPEHARAPSAHPKLSHFLKRLGAFERSASFEQHA